MTLWIVRHGQTEANASGLLLGRADPDLDQVGRNQAEQIAQALPVPDRVISSSLARTRQTAAAIARDVTQDVEIDDHFIELDYGDFDLQPLSSLPADVWRQWQSNLKYCPPNGESMLALYKRVSEGLDQLVEAAGEQNVVVVSHVTPIKAALCWALGARPESIWRSWVGQASITRIEVSKRGPSLHEFNSMAHLGD